MKGNQEHREMEQTEDLTQVLEVINAKGEHGEIKEILNDHEKRAEREMNAGGNDVVII